LKSVPSGNNNIYTCKRKKLQNPATYDIGLLIAQWILTGRRNLFNPPENHKEKEMELKK